MKTIIFILIASLLIGCVPKDSLIAVNFSKKNNVVSPSSILAANVSSVQIINNKLVINGNGFSSVSNVKVDGTAFSELFSIESKTATQIIANSIRAFSFDVSKVFNVILSDANASATFPIDFSLCNATLNGKGFDCAAPVADKDVLSYDAVSGTWKPRAVSGLNYLGAFNASTNPATGPATQPAGAYYIISASGTIASIPFTIGDWLVSNGSAWQKIDNSTAVLSVFGRNGAVTAQTGDYTLDMLGDISFPTAPVAGKVLKFDGTNWVAGDDLSGGGAGSVSTSEIADGAVTDAKIVTLATSKLTGTISSSQITDGTIVNADINAAAAIDYSKLNIPNTTIPYAKLNIADGDIPATKISGLPSAAAILSTTITDGDTTHAPDGNIIFDTFATKLDKTGGTISTILNVPTPVLNTEATTKLYVDTADNLKANRAGDTFSGALTLDNDLLIKGGSNYVTVKGNAGSATYTLTLPANAGAANQVLTTNGSGALSWSSTSSVVSSLDAANISTGVVSNTEFNWLDGVTSSIQAQLNAKEASLPTGGTALQYFAGDKTLQTLNTTAVAEGSNLYFTNARAIASPLTGVSSTAGAITAADTILDAFGKVINTQGDYVSKSTNSTVLSQLTVSGTGSIIVPTPTLLTHAANMGYVQTYVDTYGQWSKNGGNVYRVTGNVGVGTVNPMYPIDARKTVSGGGFDPVIVSTAPAGSIMIGSHGGVNKIVSSNVAGSAAQSIYIEGPVSDPIPIYYLNTNDLRIQSSTSQINFGTSQFRATGNSYFLGGNLGVGTSSPAAKLSVESTGAVGIQVKTTGAAAVDTMNLINDMDDAGIFWFAKGSSATAAPSSSNRLMNITNQGNVEIYGQQVNGTTDASGVLGLKTQAAGDGGTKNEVSLEFYADRTNLDAASGLLGFESDTAFDMTLKNSKNGNLIFGTNNTEKMRITSDGYVGIGNNNPTKALSVSGEIEALTVTANAVSATNISAGSISAGTMAVSSANTGWVIGGFRNTSVTGYSGFSLLDNAGATKGFMGYSNPSALVLPSTLFYTSEGAGVPLILGTNRTERMRITDTGIGVNGSNSGYIFYVNGTAGGTSAYVNTSDRRLKKDIMLIPNALEKISQLRGVSYNWNHDVHPELVLSQREEMGVIAQEVEKVFPDAVSENEETGIKSVAYTMLIAPLIEAVKTLNKMITDIFSVSHKNSREIASVKAENALKEQKIKKLEQKTKKLEQENLEMKARLDKIEKMLK